MQDVENKLKDAARGLLSEGKVDVVVGYERGSLPLRSRPAFFRSAEAVDRMVWDPFCSNNLAVYLPRLFERPANPRQEYAPPTVAIVVKGCDARSVAGLLKEHQIPRDKLVMVGVPCPGLVDTAKVTAALDGVGIAGGQENGDGTLDVTDLAGGKKKLKTADVLADACLECGYSSTELADVTVEGQPRATAGERYAKMQEFEAKSPEERWQYFADETSKCIRCYACRQACPNCYCKVCFIDQSKPSWAGKGDDRSDTMLYHIGRIFHQAGRCVECDACVRACPVGIDLRVFTQKLGKDVEELFGYVPGLSADDLPPLCTFTQEDSESFITDPEEAGNG